MGGHAGRGIGRERHPPPRTTCDAPASVITDHDLFAHVPTIPMGYFGLQDTSCVGIAVGPVDANEPPPGETYTPLPWPKPHWDNPVGGLPSPKTITAPSRTSSRLQVMAS
jgi:hypothetical protein